MCVRECVCVSVCVSTCVCVYVSTCVHKFSWMLDDLRAALPVREREYLMKTRLKGQRGRFPKITVPRGGGGGGGGLRGGEFT